MRFPMVQPVTEMTKAALGARLAPGADEYLDMFHDDAVFEFPFGIGGPVHIEGVVAGTRARLSCPFPGGV